jgi:hypothetical protein
VRRDRGQPKGDLASFSFSASVGWYFSDERNSKFTLTVYFSDDLLLLPKSYAGLQLGGAARVSDHLITI